MSEHLIVVSGNPVNGFHFTGPFTTTEAAHAYADYEVLSDWWIAPLNRVDDQQPWVATHRSKADGSEARLLTMTENGQNAVFDNENGDSWQDNPRDWEPIEPIVGDMLTKIDDLQDALADAGIEYELRREYNGRGMGDATCVGIVVASHDLSRAIVTAGNVDGALKAGLLIDNMGRRVILYWPAITL